MVISSLLLACASNSTDDVRARLHKTAGVEISEAHSRRFALVLQTASTQVATAIMEDMRTWPGVSGVELSPR